MGEFRKMVFTVAVAEAQKIRKANPNLTVAEATKKAWKTKVVLDARAKYDALKAKSAAKPAAKPKPKAKAKPKAKKAKK